MKSKQVVNLKIGEIENEIIQKRKVIGQLKSLLPKPVKRNVEKNNNIKNLFDDAVNNESLVEIMNICVAENQRPSEPESEPEPEPAVKKNKMSD